MEKNVPSIRKKKYPVDKLLRANILILIYKHYTTGTIDSATSRKKNNNKHKIAQYKYNANTFFYDMYCETRLTCWLLPESYDIHNA